MSQRLLYNGNFLTMDEGSSTADSVLVEGGRIKAVGRKAECRAIATHAEEVNLDGQTVIPGFIDPHGHFPDSGFLNCIASTFLPLRWVLVSISLRCLNNCAKKPASLNPVTGSWGP